MNRVLWILVAAAIVSGIGEAGSGTKPLPEVKKLIHDLNTGDAKVKLAAADALFELGVGAAPATSALIDALQTRDEDLRLRSAMALAKIGKPAVGALVKLLQNPDRATRYYALTALAWAGADAEDATADIARMLTDEDADVRRKAATVLGRIGVGDAKTLPALQEALHDGELGVREAAADALTRIGPSAVPTLIGVVRQKKTPESLHAIIALGEIGPAARASIAALGEALRSTEPALRDAAALALTKIGPAARPELVDAARTGALATRAAAVRALGANGVQAVPDLLELLTSKHADTRRAAAEALKPFKAADQAIVEALAEGLKDHDEMVRLRCAEALKEIGPAAKPAAPQLREVLLDINYHVRATAYAALLDMKDDPLPLLRKLRQGKDERTRILAALFSAPEGSENEASWQILHDGLKDKDLDVRMQAAFAWGSFRKELTTPIFVQGLKSKSPGVREQAIDGYWRNHVYSVGTEEPARILLDMVRNDPESAVRQLATRVLINVRFDAKVMVPELTKLLRDVDPRMRETGVKIVCNYGVAAIPLMTERFEDADPRVREEACHCLRYMCQTGTDFKPALDQLRALARHKDAGVRESVLWLLGPIGETAWDDLVACLKDSDGGVRDRALYQLREQRGVPNIPTKRLNIALADLLKSHLDSKVRLFAVASLDNRDSDAFAPLFEAAKSDKDNDVRLGALWRLGGFKAQAKPALPLLIGALKDPSAATRYKAAYALSEMGPAAADAIPHLIDAFQDKEYEVRQSAAFALSHLGNEAIAPVFKVLTKGTSETRRWALLVLRNRKYHDKNGLPVLIACLKDANDHVRWQTCLILEGMGKDAEDAAAALRMLLRDPDREVVDAASRALKAIETSTKEKQK